MIPRGRLLFLLALTACADEPQPESAADSQAPAPADTVVSPYIGVEHTMSVTAIATGTVVLPDDLEIESVVYLDNTVVPGGPPQNALTRVSGPPGSMVWLEELVQQDPAGESRWRVAGVLNLPAVDAGGENVIVSKQCMIGERRDPSMVAIASGPPNASAWFTRFTRAWRIDMPNRRFVPFEPADLRCPARPL